MDADWYVDPLGRFEGRYFDGESWTEQVSDHGVLAVDPDWGRDLSAGEVETAEPRSQTAQVVSGSGSAFSHATRSGASAESNPIVVPLVPDPADGAVEMFDGPAVTGTLGANRFGAATSEAGDRDYSVESPTRTVAVLHDDDETVTTVQVTGDTAIRVDGDGESRRSGRGWLWTLVGLAALAALALFALPQLLGSGGEVAVDDPSAQASDGDGDGAVAGPDSDGDGQVEAGSDADTQQDAAADGEGGQDGFGGSDAPLSAEDSVRVAGYDVVNAKQVLSDLVIWHRRHAEERGVAMPADSGCWFGVMGNAVVQNAQCGPVRATPGAEPRFDLVPLKFEDVDANVIRVRPLTDAVVVDEVLPNEIELIGSDGSSIDRYDLAERFDPPARGARNTGG